MVCGGGYPTVGMICLNGWGGDIILRARFWVFLGWALIFDLDFLGLLGCLNCICIYLCTLASQVLFWALSLWLYFSTFD